jgi:O-antigen ligase
LGIRHLEDYREAHSLYLDIAANHGLLGLITFFAIFAITLRDLARARRRWQRNRPALAAICTGYFLALIAYLATGLFLHLSYARYLWLMLGLAAAAGNIANRLPLEESAPAETPVADAARPGYGSA